MTSNAPNATTRALLTSASIRPLTPKWIDLELARRRAARCGHGTRGGRSDVRLLGGDFEFGSPDAALDVGAIAKRTANRDLPRRTCGEIY